jgi:hypothetical protein
MLRRMMLRKRFWSTAWDAVIFSVFGLANRVDSEYFSGISRDSFCRDATRVIIQDEVCF